MAVICVIVNLQKFSLMKMLFHRITSLKVMPMNGQSGGRGANLRKYKTKSLFLITTDGILYRHLMI